jgi:type I restriction enzyme S subunit
LDSIDSYVLDELGIKLPEVEDKMCFCVSSEEVQNNRVNVYYYQPKFIRLINQIRSSKFKVESIESLSLKITDGTHFTPKYVSKGVSFLSVKNVRKNQIDFDNTKFISEEEHNLLIKRCKPEPFDILFTKVGTIGLSAVIPHNAPEFSIFVSLALLKLDKTKVNPYYVSAYLNSRCTHIQIDRVLKGIGVPDLHLENITEIEIPIPTLEIQNEIAEEVKRRISEAERLKAETNKIIEEAKKQVEGMILGD